MKQEENQPEDSKKPLEENGLEKKEANTEKEQEGIDPEILEDLPPEVREVVKSSIMMQRYTGPMPNPLLSKINDKHIDKILDLAEKEDTNSYNDAQSSKKYGMAYFLIFIAVFIFITLYLAKDDKELFMDILSIVISIAGGFGGGYGYKSYVDSRKNN